MKQSLSAILVGADTHLMSANKVIYCIDYEYFKTKYLILMF